MRTAIALRHDHYYPAQGCIVRTVPHGSVVAAHHGETWFLPPGCVSLGITGAPYCYANSVYYAPAPGWVYYNNGWHRHYRRW